jgi:transposase-like protein
MTATPSIELPAWMAEQLSQASPDLLRQMVQIFAEALMSADPDAVCGAAYGQRSPVGVPMNSRLRLTRTKETALSGPATSLRRRR